MDTGMLGFLSCDEANQIKIELGKPIRVEPWFSVASHTNLKLFYIPFWEFILPLNSIRRFVVYTTMENQRQQKNSPLVT
jgi:hypothetical protein